MAFELDDALVHRPGTPGVEPVEPLQQLFTEISRVIASEKALGFNVDNDQPAESFERMEGKIRGLLQGYIKQSHTDWHKYAHFNSEHYVRNLVASSEDAELLVLCWQPGQVSRIHDHHRAHGFVTVLEGAVQEVRYVAGRKLMRTNSFPTLAPPLPGVIESLAPCPALEEAGRGVAERGASTLYINDHIALHSVGCATGSDAPAVTLHLYCPPVRRVQLFEPENDRMILRTPGYYSINGQVVQ